MLPQFSCVPLRSTSENCAVLPCFSDFGCFPTAHFLTFPFQEFRTAGKFAQGLKELGLETEEGLAITGVKGYLKGKGAPGITVALMGEFDGLPIPNCKYAGSRNKPISYIQHTSFQDENYVAECP